MPVPSNINDLVEKIEWEGGIAGALDYGFTDIDDYDVPDELKDSWADMAVAWEDFTAQRYTVSTLLNDYTSKYNMDKEF